MYKSPLFFLLALSLLIISGSTAAAEKILTSPQTTIFTSGQATQKNQPASLNKTTQKFIHYLEERLRLKLTIQLVPWMRALSSAEKGEGMVYGIYKTPEREKKFLFSEAIFADTVWLVTRCDQQFPFHSIADLKGKSIGMAHAASAGIDFDQGVNVIFKPEYSTTDLSGIFRKLFQKRMDAFIYHELNPGGLDVSLHFYNQLYAKEFSTVESGTERTFCALTQPVSTIDNYLAISLSMDPGVLKKINAIILQGKKNGDLKRIFRSE